MKNIILTSIVFLLAISSYRCNNSDPVSTKSNIINEISNMDLIASGDWTFAIKYTPLPDPFPSLPAPLADARVFIEKVGVGVISDTLISDNNGMVVFHTGGQYSNGEYKVRAEHFNKNDAMDMGGGINVVYNISPAGIYKVIYCFFVDPIEE